MLFQSTTLLAASLLPFLTSARAPPPKAGLTLTFAEPFTGAQGALPSTSTWNIMDAINTNNEVQTYTTSNTNLQLSGGSTLQIIPRKSPKDGHWTSGRIETKGSWTPQPGKKMVLEAELAVGCTDPARCQGIWPAFWALGDAMRHGTAWPLAGEIDVLEMVNGEMTAHGTTHCGTAPGGPCNEETGIGGTVGVPGSGFNAWSVTVDRTAGDWTGESISWGVNGREYFRIEGSRVGDMGTWATLAHSPLYLVANVAVGGNWPKPPNAQTVDGFDAMMEIGYIAVYESA